MKKSLFYLCQTIVFCLFVFGLHIAFSQTKINPNQKMKTLPLKSEVDNKKKSAKKGITSLNPIKLDVLQINSNLVNLTWSDSALEDGYTIQRKPSGGLKL